MKKVKLGMMICVLLNTLSCTAQNSDANEVKKVISAFSKAGDANNAKELDIYLDANFRVVMNRLFGSEDVSVMPKDVYVEKIRTKEFGGDTRVLTFENVVTSGATASAKVTFKGKEMTFVSIITLIKDASGNWKLVGEVPIVI